MARQFTSGRPIDRPPASTRRAGPCARGRRTGRRRRPLPDSTSRTRPPARWLVEDRDGLGDRRDQRIERRSDRGPRWLRRTDPVEVDARRCRRRRSSSRGSRVGPLPPRPRDAAAGGARAPRRPSRPRRRRARQASRPAAARLGRRPCRSSGRHCPSGADGHGCTRTAGRDYLSRSPARTAWAAARRATGTRNGEHET